MLLDGDEVMINDPVYDILLGGGSVKSVTPVSCRVQFDNRVVQYTGNGMFGQRRRLYWRDPVFMLPKKFDHADWVFYRSLIDLVNARV